MKSHFRGVGGKTTYLQNPLLIGLFKSLNNFTHLITHLLICRFLVHFDRVNLQNLV